MCSKLKWAKTTNQEDTAKKTSVILKPALMNCGNSSGFAVLFILILCLQLVAFSAASPASSQLSATTPGLMGNRAKMVPLLCFLKDSLVS